MSCLHAKAVQPSDGLGRWRPASSPSERLDPAPGPLDVDGLDLTEEALAAALPVDDEERKAELPQIQEWFEKFGDQLPTVLWTELDGLRSRLGA